jgi:hypothetical protein
MGGTAQAPSGCCRPDQAASHPQTLTGPVACTGAGANGCVSSALSEKVVEPDVVLSIYREGADEEDSGIREVEALKNHHGRNSGSGLLGLVNSPALRTT